MPVNMVEPGEEKYWTKAKALAEKAGRAKDWKYIAGIFQRMTGKKSLDRVEVSDLKKSLGSTLPATPRFVLTKWPGQVPSRENIEALRLAKEEPKPWSMARLLSQNGTYLSPLSVVDGLGMNQGQQKEWIGHLKKAATAHNELTFRQDIVGKMLQDRMNPDLRKAIFQRAMKFYKDMRKSMVEVKTPDELCKSTSPALSTDELHKSIHRRVRRSSGGLPLSQLSDLVCRYGVKPVADELKKSCDAVRGSLEYRNNVLIKRTPKR